MEGREVDFEACVREALESLPPDLAAAVSNVEIEVADADRAHPRRLGLYHGIPLTRRTSSYVFVLPDRITVYREPLERLYGRDPDLLERKIKHVVLHEVAHHFGISDERLREMGRY